MFNKNKEEIYAWEKINEHVYIDREKKKAKIRYEGDTWKISTEMYYVIDLILNK